jgi:hypothetical protein
LTAEWYDVVTGTTRSAGTVGTGRATFTSPWSTPALLHLSAA